MRIRRISRRALDDPRSYYVSQTVWNLALSFGWLAGWIEGLRARGDASLADLMAEALQLQKAPAPRDYSGTRG